MIIGDHRSVSFRLLKYVFQVRQPAFVPLSTFPACCSVLFRCSVTASTVCRCCFPFVPLQIVATGIKTRIAIYSTHTKLCTLIGTQRMTPKRDPSLLISIVLFANAFKREHRQFFHRLGISMLVEDLMPTIYNGYLPLTMAMASAYF
jgi:hypothetical protein